MHGEKRNPVKIDECFEFLIIFKRKYKMLDIVAEYKVIKKVLLLVKQELYVIKYKNFRTWSLFKTILFVCSFKIYNK